MLLFNSLYLQKKISTKVANVFCPNCQQGLLQLIKSVVAVNTVVISKTTFPLTTYFYSFYFYSNRKLLGDLKNSIIIELFLIKITKNPWFRWVFEEIRKRGYKLHLINFVDAICPSWTFILIRCHGTLTSACRNNCLTECLKYPRKAVTNSTYISSTSISFVQSLYYRYPFEENK